jgi:hypothetical protein
VMWQTDECKGNSSVFKADKCNFNYILRLL